MMRVRRPRAEDALSDTTRKDLERRQRTANRYAAGERRIRHAWNRFSGTPSRAEVQQKLDEVFHSCCAYCEIIVPRDIEHYHPKSKFPGKMFRWDNFLRACKNCNTDKLDEFPLAPDGSPVLLDPCSDEPPEFFTWDLTTGESVLSADPARSARGDVTRKAFGLDHQQLCEERRIRARHFLFVLLQSIEETRIPPDVHDWLLDELNPTRPWRSILRQIVRDPARRALVDRVKQAVPAAAPLLAELAARETA